MKPFVKWAGGKRDIAPQILCRMPERIDRYFEPFVGGGAVFFALAQAGRIKRAFLSDTNSDLIAAYRAVRDEPAALIESLQFHAIHHRMSQRQYYYSVRGSQPTSDLERGARLIYLNKTCYNGLYRENKRGEFNVPIGRYSKPLICDADGLMAASKALAIADLRVCSFDEIEPGCGDVVYCDPPYEGCFCGYQAGGFGRAQQRDLHDRILAWQKTGCRTVLSNSDHPFIRELYPGYQFQVMQVVVRYGIGGKGASRDSIRGELLISGGGR